MEWRRSSSQPQRARGGSRTECSVCQKRWALPGAESKIHTGKWPKILLSCPGKPYFPPISGGSPARARGDKRASSSTWCPTDFFFFRLAFWFPVHFFFVLMGFLRSVCVLRFSVGFLLFEFFLLFGFSTCSFSILYLFFELKQILNSRNF
jgi:hypothetical protein